MDPADIYFSLDEDFHGQLLLYWALCTWIQNARVQAWLNFWPSQTTDHSGFLPVQDGLQGWTSSRPFITGLPGAGLVFFWAIILPFLNQAIHLPSPVPLAFLAKNGISFQGELVSLQAMYPKKMRLLITLRLWVIWFPSLRRSMIISHLACQPTKTRATF